MYSRSSDDLGCLGTIAILVIGVVVVIFTNISNAITDQVALSHFRRLAQTENVVIVSRTNDSPVPFIGGDPHDVTYELLIKEKPSGGRCVSGWNSPIVCRLYGIGAGD